MTTKRSRTTPAAKSLPDDPTQQQLLRQLDAERVKADAKAEARKIAEAAKTEQREPVPANYAVRDSTLPVIPADEVQTALHFLRTQGVPNPASAVSWAVLHVPEVCRECVRAYRLDGSVRSEKFAPILAAWRGAHP
jgi:hypothetical protein